MTPLQRHMDNDRQTMMSRSLIFVFGLLLSTATLRAQRPANIAVGITHKTCDSLRYSSLNLGLFANVDTLRGVQAGVFTSATRMEMRGLNIGGLSAFARGRMYGVQIGGVVNGVEGEMRGVQFTAVSNVARQANGIQLAGLSNVCTAPMRGVQLSGITNIAMGVKRGVQSAGVANVCSSSMRGVQLAMYNYADTLSGSQFGFFNVCVSHPKGVQVGIINYSNDTIARKIGLVNVNPRTTVDFMAYGGSSTKTNIGVRFRNRSTYNIIGIGTHYMGLDEKFSGALFYRIGQYFSLGRRWSLGGDVGYYHVETFEENSDSKPERLYSLQARINIDCRIGRVLGAFATVGYGETRYYYHARHYRDRAILEAGLTFNYK